MTHTIKDCLLVEIPAIATDPWVINNGKESVGLNWYEPDKVFGEEGNVFSTGVKLPEGSYAFITTSEVITETQAKEIVGYGFSLYQNYQHEGEVFTYDTALDSFRSLLTSLSIGRAVIVKKLK